MFTRSDLREVRPGLLKLDGHELYLGAHEIKEPCARCGGRGKAESRSASGRKSWMKCNGCNGKGQVSALKNVEDPVNREYSARQRASGARTWQSCIVTHDVSVDSFLERLNHDDRGESLMNHECPCFVWICNWPEAVAV
jgi:hypothetical protein